MLEALQQPHAAAADEPAVQAVAEAVDVKQRQREQKAIGARDLPAGQQIQGVGGEVVVRENGALGGAGGAGSIDERGGRVAIESAAAVRAAALRPAARETPDGRGGFEAPRVTTAGLGVGQDMRDLAVAIEDIDRHEDHAELHAGEIEIDHLDAVGQIDAQPVAWPEAAPAKRLRQAAAALVDFAEGEGAASNSSAV